MKKILIFSLAYYPKFIGGAEVAIKEITNRINNDDYEFHMVTLRFDSALPIEEKIDNVIIHRIGLTISNPSMSDLRKFPLHLNKLVFQFSAFFKAISLHRKYKFDGVWAMMAHSCGVPATLFKIFYPNVKFILTLQEGDPPEYIKRKMLPVYPIFLRAFRSADFIQTISVFLSNWAKSMGALCKIEVVPNAVDTKHFSKIYSNNEIEEVKKVINKKEGDVFLITTSRLVKKNGIDDVIKAMKFLPSNFYFLVYGLGPDLEMLKDLVKSESVEGWVRFLGQLSHAEMPKYLKSCDIFIRPSLSEGMGNSFVEAMAAEVPVIATQVGGIADFLYDPEINSDKEPTGRAVKVHDPEGIARQVKAYLENPELTKRIVVNAKKLAFERYDWNLIAKQMKENVFDYVFK